MTYEILCDNCDTDYIITDDDDLEIEPNYCPYCGNIQDGSVESYTSDDDDMDI